MQSLAKEFSNRIKNGDLSNCALSLSNYVSYSTIGYQYPVQVCLNLHGIVATTTTRRISYITGAAYEAWERLVEEGNVG